MKDYEWSMRPKEATTDEIVEQVHSQIMCGKSSLHEVARQMGIRFKAVS